MATSLGATHGWLDGAVPRIAEVHDVPDRTHDPATHPRVIIVSNRLPYAVGRLHDDMWLQPTSGGLARALLGVHAKRNSLWIGAADASLQSGDASESRLRERLESIRLRGISLSEQERIGYYRRYASGILWPALHGIEADRRGDGDGWAEYVSVNARFADAIARECRPGDVIWIHDFHLMLVPAMLRERVPRANIGFFLHTPFRLHPTASLDEWPSIARGLSGADVVGFQTRRDVRAFAGAVGHTMCDDISTGATGAVTMDGRVVRLRTCPIAVDHMAFAARSRLPAVVKQRAGLRVDYPGPLFLGVDRLDYTKGIRERLLAFRRLLDFEPGLRGQARFIQVAVPTREGVEGYDVLRAEIEELVTSINADCGNDEWRPVEYIHGSVDSNTLVALYGAADIMVVTPRCDGMNLVAKEFVASRTDGGGALILSRTAGAAEELRAAILVDPEDVVAIVTAYRYALRMSASERRTRMRKLRESVRARDVLDWADDFIGALV